MTRTLDEIMQIAERFSRSRWSDGGVWVAVAGLTAAQAWFTSHAVGQIRYEELAESVRNVYWLDEGQIYDGISSNVGWYALLLVTYNIFGFTLHAAKYVRLALHVVFLGCLADVLRRWMGHGRSIVPLVAIGLSPALLTFNSMQTSYGIDLQCAPICLWRLLMARRASGLFRSTAVVGLWSTAMIAAMSYPTFLFYVPLLAAWGWKDARWNHIALSVVAFLAPLGLMLLSVAEPMRLLYDPQTGSGIFRGGGAMWSIQAPPVSIAATVGDLFVRGRSYHFELAAPDLSGPAGGIVALFLLFGLLALTWRAPATRPLALFACALLAIGLLFPSLDPRFSGL